MQKRPNRTLGLVVFAGLVCFSFDAFAQTNPGMVGGTADSSQAPFVPSAFIVANDPFAGSSFASCDAQVQLEESTRATLEKANNFDAKKSATESVAAMAGGMLGGANAGQIGGLAVAGQSANCEDVPITLSTSDIDTSCDNYMMGGKFQEERLNKAIAKAREAAELATCKSRKASQSRKLVECFKTEFDNFKKSLELVKKDFDQNLTAMNKYVGEVKATIEKETQKADQMDERVGAFSQQIGDLQSALTKLSGAGGEGAIAGLAQNVQRHKERVIGFSLDLPREQAQMIRSCAMGGGARDTAYSTCPANLAAASMTDCLFSYYHGYVKDAAGGGNAGQAKADEQLPVFRNEVNQMLNDFGGSSPMTSEVSFFSRHGATLSKYGAVGAQLKEEIRKCIKQAPGDMNKMLADPGNQLGATAAALANEATEISDSVGATLNEIDPLIRNAGKEIYGQELNQYFDAYRCNEIDVSKNSMAQPALGNTLGAHQVRVSSLQTQLTCVKNLAGTMRAMLNGGPPPNSSQPIQVPLNVTDAQGAPVRCQGLRDCADKAQKISQASRQRVASLEGSGTYSDPRCPQGCPGLKKFHQDSNQQIRTAFQTVADLFASRVAVMKAQFERVKGLLGKVGINFAEADSEGIDMEGVCPLSEHEVCPVPADFSKILAKLAGAPDVSNADFGSAVAEAKSAEEENTKLAQEYNDAFEVLNDKLAACRVAADEKKLESKLAGLDLKLQKHIRECKQAVRLNPENTDFGGRFSPLLDDLEKICSDSPTNASCKVTTENIQAGNEACEDYASQREQQNKPTQFVIQTGGSGDSGVSVGGGQ